MYDLTQTITGRSADEIAEGIEASIRRGAFAPGAQIPTVRSLASDLDVSPNTVASAYGKLRARGILITRGRKGTRVSARPPLSVATSRSIPEGVRDLADGNPDPERFPRLDGALRSLDLTPRLYGEAANHPDLVRLAKEQFENEKIPVGSVAIVGGGLDAIERILRAHLRPGDRIALEDPSYSGVLDLVHSLGLDPIPMAIDDRGPLPSAMFYALDAGASATIVTPRAQNPTGATLDAERASELRDVLQGFPEALVIEDDHAGPISGAPAVSICRETRSRWAVTRSVAKWLGPDLRLAILNGDAATVARVQGRQMIGAGWVSKILQQIVVALWRDESVRTSLDETARIYANRRDTLRVALVARGIEAHGSSGLNLWVPVPEESRVVQALFDRGYAVASGERFRIESGPAIRITTSTLEPAEVERFATVLESCLGRADRTRSA